MIKDILDRLIRGVELSAEEAESVMEEIISGQLTPAQIAGFLVSLRMKGESAEEILGCARAMRSKMINLPYQGEETIDTCGTGGDHTGTFNVSTTVAFVLAGAGEKVAKHGNRSVSSRCGSADVLEHLGVKIELKPENSAKVLQKTGIAFLYAPIFHPALRYAGEVRKDLELRTVFNILGPLANPAGVAYQVLGVYDPRLTEKMAKALKEMGCKAALVVSGGDGLDELSNTGRNIITELKNGKIVNYSLEPEEVGLERKTLAELQGGDARENARIVRGILEGEQGAKREIVLLNAGAGLYLRGRVESIAAGIKLAAESIDRGLALKKLEEFGRETRKLN